jgi:tRNA G46 methylase TrmB
MRKDLSSEEFNKMPKKVQLVYMYSASRSPISHSFYIEVLAEYPEYFQEEIKDKANYDAIPQEVHDAHEKESSEFKSKYNQSFHGKGKSYMATDWKEYLEQVKRYSSYIESIKPELKNIFDKHYKKYGLKYGN